ncbi:hypothetical protein VTN49DRAFT_7618 [Thermomyces lanuginosus]|uniref:uncharacterized protein n=1 Tax=Thermomyces lanuginosus TaxID=5541 RepID=UPI00374410CF
MFPLISSSQKAPLCRLSPKNCSLISFLLPSLSADTVHPSIANRYSIQPINNPGIREKEKGVRINKGQHRTPAIHDQPVQQEIKYYAYWEY